MVMLGYGQQQTWALEGTRPEVQLSRRVWWQQIKAQAEKSTLRQINRVPSSQGQVTNEGMLTSKAENQF